MKQKAVQTPKNTVSILSKLKDFGMLRMSSWVRESAESEDICLSGESMVGTGRLL